MSDATATPPAITIAQQPDGAMVALLHLPGKLRQAFANGPEDLARRLASACISEFGMRGEDAEAHAEHAVLDHAQGQEHLSVLQDQLADSQAEHEAARLKWSDAETRLADAQKELERMTAEIAERDGKIGTLEALVAELRNNAAAGSIAAKNPSPDAGSAAAGTQGTVTKIDRPQRLDTPPPAEVGAAAGADGPAAAAASKGEPGGPTPPIEPPLPSDEF